MNEKDELKQFIFKFNIRAEEVDLFSLMTRVCEIDIVDELDPWMSPPAEHYPT